MQTHRILEQNIAFIIGVATQWIPGARESSPGVKVTTHLHLVPRSKNAWNYISTRQYAFMAWFLVKHRDKFTFTFTFTGVAGQFM
jgi:hypothetical protein